MATSGFTPELHRARGLELRKAGRLEEALAEFEQAIALRADYAPGYFNLASIRMEQGRIDDAARLWRRAIEIKPDYYHAHAALGSALRRLGQIEPAIAACRRAIELKGDFVDGHLNLGSALHAARRMTEAAAAFETALRLDPNHVTAMNNYAILLIEIDQPARATALYERAIALAPDRPEMLNNLGNVLKMQARLDEAIDYYRRTLALMPGAHGVHSNLLLTLNADPRADDGLLDEHLAWANQHAAAIEAAPRRAFTHDRNPQRRLRVGFVSGDFRRHAVASFFRSVLDGRDRNAFEAICYSNVIRPDDTTAALQQLADRWRTITGIPDDRAAGIILDDRIDILVDLSGHTAENRLLLFARRPAPIQMTYLGYPNTAGLRSIDYRITDAFADPPGMTEAHHTEALLRLEGGFLCYFPSPDAPDPRGAASSGDPITFGTFNNFAKVSAPTIALWSRLLAGVPDSRLLIKAETLADPATRQRVESVFASHQVDPQRLILLGREPSFQKHLQTYHRIDIAVDTFPYHGTTTTCEAMWMGVPVITLAGRAHVSRVGVSLLNQVGLPQLIAGDASEFVEIGMRLAADREALAEISGNPLRERMRRSPLMDRGRFAVAIADAFRKAWRQWCTTLPNDLSYATA